MSQGVEQESVLSFQLGSAMYGADLEAIERLTAEQPTLLYGSRDFAPGVAEVSIYGRTYELSANEVGTALDGHIVLNDYTATHGALTNSLSRAIHDKTASPDAIFSASSSALHNVIRLLDKKSGITHIVALNHHRGLIDISNAANIERGSKHVIVRPPSQADYPTDTVLEAYFRVFDQLSCWMRELSHFIPTQSAPVSELELNDNVPVRALGATSLEGVIGGAPGEHPEHRGSAFDKIGGLTYQKGRLMEIVHVASHPEILQSFGAKPIQSILLYGLPGTGKTTLAEALGEDLAAEVITVRSTDVVDQYIGNSAKNLAAIFKKAYQKKGRVLLLLDEFDTIINNQGGSQEYNQMGGVFKKCMDELSEHANVMVVATTNRDLHSLSPDLIRGGRIQEKIQVTMPDTDGRIAIITNLVFADIYEKAQIFDESFGSHIPKLAEATDNLSGADITNIMGKLRFQKAAQQIKTRERSLISPADFMRALEAHKRQ